LVGHGAIGIIAADVAAGAHTMSLYKHTPHKHEPRNVNKLHAATQTGINARIAVMLTKRVGTMWTAYSFIVLAVVGLFAILGLLSPLVALLVAWTSQTLIQLVLLPVIMVGQNVLGAHAELLAEEQYQTTEKSYHDLEQVMEHLSSQDAELLKQTELLVQLLKSQSVRPLPRK
jgi:uncharacterized membrane protein